MKAVEVEEVVKAATDVIQKTCKSEISGKAYE